MITEPRGRLRLLKRLIPPPHRPHPHPHPVDPGQIRRRAKMNDHPVIFVSDLALHQLTQAQSYGTYLVIF